MAANANAAAPPTAPLLPGLVGPRADGSARGLAAVSVQALPAQRHRTMIALRPSDEFPVLAARLIVYGVAQPQGSKAARVVKGRAILTEGFGDGPRKRKAWREAVADSAREYQSRYNKPLLDQPVELVITFYLPRPSSASKRIVYPAKKPDLSKTIRGVEDSLTGIIVADDARFVNIHAYKRFAEGHPPCMVLGIFTQ